MEGVQLFKMLVDAGARPGDDFTANMTESVMRVSDRGFTLLRAKYPEINWEDVTQTIVPDIDAPAHALNELLGVDFVGNLIEFFNHRLRILPDAKAAWYMHLMLPGMFARTGVEFYALWERQASPLQKLHGWHLINFPFHLMTECHDWMKDMVLAAGGGTEDYLVNEHSVDLSQKGFDLLKQVWTGNCQVERQDMEGPGCDRNLESPRLVLAPESVQGFGYPD